MNFLLITLGSSGDVNPFVGLGTALKAHGHSVTLATNPYFEDLARRAGLAFIPVGTRAEFEASLTNPDLWHPRKGLKFVMRGGIVPFLRTIYELTREFCRTPNSIVVASMLALGARLAQEKLGIPLVTVHLQPQAIQSLDDTPVYPHSDISRWPRWAKRLVFALGDHMVEGWLSPEFQNFRKELGLPPVRHVLTKWVHSPQLTLGLWPDWFCAPQKDWPRQVKLTGFPLYDAASVETVPAELETFLSAGVPPVIFTPGSAMRQGKAFFEESIAACRLTGCRGILLTRFQEQIPASLPDGVKSFGYVPFSQVLPRASAFVHHGGIGTTAQALAAGVPQIIMPLSHDQPDNAARVARLGAGVVLTPSRYKARAVASALQRFQTESSFLEKAKQYQERLRGRDGLQETANTILGHFS